MISCHATHIISYHILFNFILSLYTAIFFHQHFRVSCSFRWNVAVPPFYIQLTLMAPTVQHCDPLAWPLLDLTRNIILGSHFSEATVGEKRQHIFWLNISRIILQDDTYYEAKNVQNKGLSDATSLTNVRNYIQIETWEWTNKVTKRGISCLCRRGHHYIISLSFLTSKKKNRCRTGIAFKTLLCEKLKFRIKSGLCGGRYRPLRSFFLWLPLDIAWFYE
jgi:hypothetical protein